MIEVKQLEIPVVKILVPKRFTDKRGYFCETYNKQEFSNIGYDLEFVQDNHSYSRYKATIRGLHFQIPPLAQAKLVRVIRGSIFDVVVDLRVLSGTYGKYVSETLSAENGKQILVPEGFAHGFMTLEDNTEVLYKTTEFYNPSLDAGIFWADPDINIVWPLSKKMITISDKDRDLPTLKNFNSPFLDQNL